jgi:hypothetical protein
MKKTLVCALLATALSNVSGVAFAVPVTINGSVANGTLLTDGKTDGVFDGKGLLPAYYQINSATFSFLFNDDADPVTAGAPQVSSTTYGNYQYAGGGYYDYWYARTGTTYQTVQKTGQQEGAALSLAGVVAGSGATSMSQSTGNDTVYQGRTQDAYYYSPGYYYSCGNHSSCWSGSYSSTYFTDNYTSTNYATKDWSGTFGISGSISDQSMLDQLLKTGRLDFSLSVFGDVYLTGSQINLDVTALAPPAPSSAVPEPSTIWLALAALGGLGYQRRRRSDAR